jgi:hypothetical protein
MTNKKFVVRPARYDYAYERNGTASLFMLFAPREGWRHVKDTERRTTIDYAQVLQELSDVHFCRGREDRSRAGQPQHPQPRLTVRSLHGHGGAPTVR